MTLARRGVAPAMLMAILVCAPPAAAELLQRGYDAGRTGDSRQAGPAWGDVSYVRDTVRFRTLLAIVGGHAYFTAAPSADRPTERIVWSMALATGVMEPFLETPRESTTGASDGTRLFLLSDGRLEAYDLATRASLWTQPLGAGSILTPLSPQSGATTQCATPSLANGTLLALCVAQPAAAAVITVQALEATTGRIRWNWTANTDPTALTGQLAGGAPLPASPGIVSPVGITVAAGWVIAVTQTDVAAAGGSPATGAYWDGWVLYPENGTAPGEHEPSFAPFPGPREPRFGHHPTTATYQNAPTPHRPGFVVGDDLFIAFKNDAHEHPASLAAPGTRLLTLYRSDLIRAGEVVLANASEAADDGLPVVMSNGSIFAGSGSQLWRVDRGLNIAWHQELPPGHIFPGGYPTLAGDRLYLMSRDEATHDTLEARDAGDGHLLWSYLFEGPYPAMAVDDGLLVVVMYSTFFVFGDTPLSLKPRVSVTESSPAPGTVVGADLSRTGPGADGPATAFRAEWGDGAVSEWSASPLLTHAYNDSGDVAARFFVRNDARQSASVPFVFHVSGAGAGVPPAWFASPLAPANLPLTLLLLGIVAVGASAGAGFLALRRRVASLGPSRVTLVAPGQVVLGKYRVERHLGEGSSGRVFLAHDVRMKRSVVLKTLTNPDHAAAIREARAAAAIDHPNVVRVYDVEELGAQALLVMEYVDGGTLKDRLATSGALSGEAFARVAQDVLAGLGAVHATGSVHRDVKPGNVLLTRHGHAKLADFGIARMPGFEATLGSAASGSVQYMAPEQARGKRVTARSDLYSAAATLYEAWTGNPFVVPLEGESATEMQMRVGAGPSFDAPVEPPALRAWFARALAAAPEERFSSAEEMRQALDAAWDR